MKLLTKNNLLKLHFIFFIFISFCKLSAQTITVTEDQNFEKLLNEKRKITLPSTFDNRFKIQIFNGSSEDSKNALVQFRKDFKNLEATIVFSSPRYKVWTGNYKTRLEAEKNFAIIKKKYPDAFLIKPISN